MPNVTFYLTGDQIKKYKDQAEKEGKTYHEIIKHLVLSGDLPLEQPSSVIDPNIEESEDEGELKKQKLKAEIKLLQMKSKKLQLDIERFKHHLPEYQKELTSKKLEYCQSCKMYLSQGESLDQHNDEYAHVHNQKRYE